MRSLNSQRISNSKGLNERFGDFMRDRHSKLRLKTGGNDKIRMTNTFSHCTPKVRVCNFY
jgi:hypothetical protein